MSKVILTEYNVTNPLLKKETSIASFADVHGDYTKLELIKDIIKELKVTAVLIQGDLIESVLGTDYSRERIAELLVDISKFSKVIFEFGNHDTVYTPAEPEEDRERLLTNNINYWNNLSSIDNIYIPSNANSSPSTSHIELSSDIEVSTISFPPDYYWFHERKEDFEEYMRKLEKIKLDLQKFNILLAHSPKNIVNGSIIDERFREYNLILSGHMHAGMIPTCLRNRSRVGLLGPGKSVFPPNSYGIVKDGNTISVTTGGVSKISASNIAAPLNTKAGFKQLLRRVYPPELEIYKLNPGSNNSISKIKSYKIKD